MKIGVGIIGSGTVGTGVLEILQAKSEAFRTDFGFEVDVRRVVSRSPKAATHPLANCVWNTDIDALLADPEIQVVVELAGGYEAPLAWIRKALAAGKHVVTANKALIAKHGVELLPLATQNNAHLLFEAAVAGGIPIIKALQESLLANNVSGLSGIINGTCNYILTEMTQKGAAFGDVLADAQAKGYAEADPTFDVDGIDASHKLAILASLATRKFVDFESFPVQGIRNVDAKDIQFASELGYTIKLLGRMIQTAQGLDVRVQPYLIPNEHLLSNVHGVLNAVHLETDRLGPALFTGAGAGAGPTASAVVGDLLAVCRQVAQGQGGVLSLDWFNESNRAELAPASVFVSRYYMRMQAVDRAGVLASIASALGEQEISIESIVQRPLADGDLADLFVVTHETSQNAMDHAVTQLNALGMLKGEIQLLTFL